MAVDIFAKVVSCQRKMENSTLYFVRRLVYCIFRLRATRRPIVQVIWFIESKKKDRGRVCANWVFNSIPTFPQRAAVFGSANILTTLLGSVTQKDLTKTFFGALSLQTRPVSQVRLASSAKVFVKAAYFSLTALNLRTLF